ncbi:MAG TPA: FKBP-type peptidyl-prolyl cis-trans isomerase [Micropepsaceae bacterium]|jgi:FKBP-type peptidyl-prolyl cis-trans isomerase|nr:FKBP-type peptidyl-prolyl cis-trans isomerase [Micropepsaceae bacterium]
MRSRISAAIAVLSFCFAGQALAGDISPQANREYLAANAAKPGVVVLPSGLQYRVVKSGAGQTPRPEDVVTVSYKGALVDGTVFDQTKPGETRNLPAGKVVPGWVEALSLMKEGDEWELVIPSDLGYGATRAGNGAIPPNQVLVFSLELIAVIRAHP